MLLLLSQNNAKKKIKNTQMQHNYYCTNRNHGDANRRLLKLKDAPHVSTESSTTNHFAKIKGAYACLHKKN